MKNTAASSQRTLTDDYLNGRWDVLSQVEAYGTGFDSAAKARALLMKGYQHEAMVILERLSRSEDVAVIINQNICLSHMAYTAGEFSRALFYANKSFLLAKKKMYSFLGDAGFYRALCLTALNEKYEALALYRQLSKLKTFTNYRLNLFLLNEAWLLWDLGLLDPLKKIIPQVEKPYSDRLSILLSFVTGDLSALNSHGNFVNYPLIEKENLFINFTEGILLYGQKRDLDNFIKSDFSKSLFNDGSKIVKQVINLIEKNEVDEKFDGRDRIDWLFIKCLLYKSFDLEKARELYFNQLLPLMEQMEYHSLFIPNRECMKSPRTAWEEKMAHVFLDHVPDKELTLYLKRRVIQYKGKEISFHKSPMAWKIIQFLMRRNRISKESLHAHLTGSRYRSDLHDSRIFKLVQRLNHKVNSTFGFEVCLLTGTNEIEVLCKLKVKEEL